MSIVQDFKDVFVSSDKEIFVKHGSFSYLVKNYSTEPSAKDAPIRDEDRDWNISVYLDGREPEFLKSSCMKLNVDTKKDSSFSLKLQAEDDDDVMSVRSSSSEKEPSIKIATGQKKGATADSTVKTLSSVRLNRQNSRALIKPKRRQLKSVEQEIIDFFCPSFTNFCFMLMSVMYLLAAVLYKGNNAPIELKLNLKNSKTLQSDQMFMDSVLQLYTVASQLNLTDMQERCVEFLKDYTEPNNVLQVLKAAHEVKGIEIKEFVKQLLPRDKSILQKYPEWSEISSTFPELIAELEDGSTIDEKSQEEMNVEK